MQAPKIWERARTLDASFTCANYFNWYNMYSSVEGAVTPRPMYPTDGRKLLDIHIQPATLSDELQSELGMFRYSISEPRTTIRSSQWVANCAMRTDARFDPTLLLIYLPHLDYNLQRLGQSNPAITCDLGEIDAIARAYSLLRGPQRKGAGGVGVRHHRGQPPGCTSTVFYANAG